MVTLDVFRIFILVLLSMFTSPSKLPQRSWGAEFVCRIYKCLVKESIGKPITWIRTRQERLTAFSFDMLKVNKSFKYVAGVAFTSFTPKQVDDSDTLIIYLHGGGYVVGSVAVYALTMARIALQTNAKVIAPEYRLAPEHALPAAQDDCLAVVLEILNDEANKDKKIILMGDSAGGGLCLATLKSLNNIDNEKNIDACVLISPWLVATDNDRIEQKNEQYDVLGMDILSYIQGMIIKDKQTQEQYLNFMDMDVSILPPLYIQTGSVEVLGKQISEFAARLEQANADYQYDVFEHQFHVFQVFAPLVKEEVEAIKRIGSFVAGVEANRDDFKLDKRLA